jgi:hypothetical protein
MDSDGICQVCAYTLDQGCLICNYSDPTKCMICASGYFMDKGKFTLNDLIDQMENVLFTQIQLIQRLKVSLKIFGQWWFSVWFLSLFWDKIISLFSKISGGCPKRG